MTAVKGKDLALYIDNNLVALSKNCKIDVTADLIEVASVLHGRAKEFRSGRYSWQVTTECLVSADSSDTLSFLTKLKDGTEVTVAVTTPLSPRLVGYALVQSLSESGSVGSMATYNVVLMGTGELEPM